jgi:hypothetical protein
MDRLTKVYKGLDQYPFDDLRRPGGPRVPLIRVKVEQIGGIGPWVQKEQ